MLLLPEVTLVIVDNVCPELAQLALQDSYKDITFGAVLVFDTFTARTVKDAQHFLWFNVPQYVKTSHILTIQWDGWVINPHLWNDDWLQYDYIGAPWDDGCVGNGGFSLRSKRLMTL